MRISILAIVSILLIMSSCRKDETIIDEVIILSGGASARTSVAGQIFAETNPAFVANSPVTIGDKTVYTDQDGFFYFHDVMVSSEGFVVKTAVEGVLNQPTRVVPVANEETFVEVFLRPIQRTDLRLVDTLLTLSDSLGLINIGIAPDAFLTADGLPYDGDIKGTTRYYDPTSRFSIREAPGSFEAIDANGTPVTLGSYGMIEASFYGWDGTELNIAPGRNAYINTVIPPSIASGAPETIPTWSLNEETGIWEEEGIATKRQNADGQAIYDYTASHFSFWNCDAPFPVTLLEGTVTDISGDPVQYAYMTITFDNNGTLLSRGGYTNSQGKYSGKVPKNKELEIEVTKNRCEDVFHQDIVPPIAGDQMTHDISGIDLDIHQIMGTLQGCNGDALSDGLVKIYADTGELIWWGQTETDGTYLLNIQCAPDSVFIRGIDPTNGTESDLQGLALFNPVTQVNAMTTCNNIETFLTTRVNGQNRTFYDVNLMQGDLQVIQIEQPNGFVEIQFEQLLLGTSSSVFNATFFDSANDVRCGSANVRSCGNLVTNITRYDTDYLQGSIVGLLDDPDGNPTQVQFTFKAAVN